MAEQELKGAELDLAVAQALASEGGTNATYYGGAFIYDGLCLLNGYHRRFAPSSKWEHGGPIIEQEGIDLQHVHTGKPEGKDDPDFFWAASIYGQKDDTPDWEGVVNKKIHHGYAKTPLEAAMRCFVASKLVK